MYIYVVGSKVLNMEKNLDAVLDMSVGRSVDMAWRTHMFFQRSLIPYLTVSYLGP